MAKKKAAKKRPKAKKRKARALTPQQWKFVSHYVVHSNATKAAEYAGYSTPHTQGSRLLRDNAQVKKALAEARKAAEARTGVTLDRVLLELERVAFANLLDYVRIDRDGIPHVDLRDVTTHQAAALAGVTVTEETIKDEKGDDLPVRRVTFKQTDKVRPLELLGKHLGAFPTKHQHSGPGGGPIPVANYDIPKDMDPQEASRLYRQLIKSTGGLPQS